MNNILITGVSSGIGYDAAKYFLSLGYRVFGSVRSQRDADRLGKELLGDFVCLQFDVVNVDDIQSAALKVEKILNGESLTALVNNAGYALAGPMAMLSDDAFRKQIEVNVFGVRNVSNAFLPMLGARKNNSPCHIRRKKAQSQQCRFIMFSHKGDTLLNFDCCTIRRGYGYCFRLR